MKITIRLIVYLTILFINTTAFSDDILPNLRPYKPNAWDDIIVISNEPETSYDSIIIAGETSFIDYAYLNDSDINILLSFHSHLVENNDEVIRNARRTGLKGGYYSSTKDFTHTFDEPGTYTIKLICDAEYVIDESIETDNFFEKTIEVFDTIPPENDLFKNAQKIEGTRGSIIDDNVFAIKESGEPSHAGRRGRHSVWFQWIAPESDIVRMDTHGSQFDTVLAVYTGLTLNSLNLIKKNDDDDSENNNSGLQFEAEKGTVYYIAVDGREKETCGKYTFNWLQITPVFIENFENENTELSIYSSPKAVNKWRIAELADAKDGNKSAFISSGIGAGASYDPRYPSFSELSVPIDLTKYISPVLTFWWKSLGEYTTGEFLPKDYGELYLNDGQNDHLISHYYEYAKNEEWTYESIDLKTFAGKNIILKFRWFNGHSIGNNPGFCIDSIKINANQVIKPVFTQLPDMIAYPGQPYSSVAKMAVYNDAQITLSVFPPLPEWLTIEYPDNSPGTVVFHGVPEEGAEPLELTFRLTSGDQENDIPFTLYVPKIHHVTTLIDSSSEGSLQTCLENANPHDIIQFDVHGRLFLNKYIYISKPLKIIGPGIENLTLDASHQFCIFQLYGSFPVHISHLTLENGFSNNNQSAFFNYRTNLYLDNIQIINNIAENGAVIRNQYGRVHANHLIIKKNKASAIFNDFASMTIENSVIENNFSNNKHTIYSEHGRMTLTNTTISNNRSDYPRFCFYNFYNTTHISNSTISNNDAGILNENGLIHLNQTCIVNNLSVLDMNEYAGGITNKASGIIFLKNSIVTGNSDNLNVPNISNYITSLGYNFIGNLLLSNYKSFTGDQFYAPLSMNIPHPGATKLSEPANPEIGPLVYLNPFIQIHPYKEISPVIDAGCCLDSFALTITQDQRGFSRPDNNCDTGPIEWSSDNMNNIFFVSQPKHNEKYTVADTYAYTISLFSSDLPVTDIQIENGQDWLEINDLNFAQGSALIKGIIGVKQLGENTITIKATNGIHTITQSHMIHVSLFSENFENFQQETTPIFINEAAENKSSWVFGQAVSYSGKKSAYISADNGETAVYSKEKSQSAMILPVDLTWVVNASLSFYWKCEAREYFDDGYPADYATIKIKSLKGTTYIKTPLFNQSEWKKELIDLSGYSGQQIEIHFIWENVKDNSVVPITDSGFCIDDISITGNYTNNLLFTTEPHKNVGIGKKYHAPITLNTVENVVLDILSKPDWLTLTGNLLQGSTALHGIPYTRDIQPHLIHIEAKNSNSTASLRYTLDVLCLYEDFEGKNLKWEISPESYTANSWTIGTGDDSYSNTFAYVSQGQNRPYFDIKKQSQTFLKYTFENQIINYIKNPFLEFDWQCIIPHYIYAYEGEGYGEVYIEDTSGNLILVSDSNEFSYQGPQACVKRQIDLSEYEGLIQSLIFKWENDKFEIYGKKPSLYVDNVAIRGNFSLKEPVFVSSLDYFENVFTTDDVISYTISVMNEGDEPVNISCLNCPDWLNLSRIAKTDEFTSVHLTSNDTIPEGQSETFCILATNGIFEVSQTFDIYAYSKDIEYRFQHRWPTLARQHFFNQPHDIAMDSNDNIYVADTKNHRIIKFNEGGMNRDSWGKKGNAPGEFNEPVNIAIGPADDIFVLDARNYRVQKFSKEGELLTHWSIFALDTLNDDYNEVKGIAVDKHSNVYVGALVPGQTCLIAKYSGTGEFIKSFGDCGYANGQFRFIQDIAVDILDNVYVIDKETYRIQKFSQLPINQQNYSFKWEKIFSIPDISNVEQISYKAIEIDRSGYLYVTDATNQSVHQFNLDGDYQKTFSIPELDDTEQIQSKPYGLACGRNGNIYVTGFANNVNNTDLLSGTIHILDKEEGTIKGSWKSFGSQPGHFFCPTGIAVYENIVHVCDSFNRRMQSYNTTTYTWEPWGKLGTNDGEFVFPYDCAVDHEGNIYVTDHDNHNVQKFNKDKKFIKRYHYSGLRNPTGIAIYQEQESNDTRLYIVNSNKSSIIIMGDSGEILNEKQYEFSFPNSIAIDSQNKWFYVADSGNRRIQKFTLNGIFLKSWGNDPNKDNMLKYPFGITINNKGDILVSDREDSKIKQYSSKGKLVRTIGYKGFNPGALYSPTGIAVDKNNKIYLTDRRQHRVQLFDMVNLTEGVTKAIIVAGKKDDNDSLWEKVEPIVNFGYLTLTSIGVAKEDIYYLSAKNRNLIDYDDRISVESTIENIEYAIESWSLSGNTANSLIVYFAGHATKDIYSANTGEKLSATSLSGWLNSIQEDNRFDGEVLVIFDTCHSGSFEDDLTFNTPHKRIFIASSKSDENSHYIGSDKTSYSAMFWQHIINGFKLKESHDYAKNIMSIHQEALLSSSNIEKDRIDNLTIGNAIQDNMGHINILNVLQKYPPDISENKSLCVQVEVDTQVSKNVNIEAYIAPLDMISLNHPIIKLPQIVLGKKPDLDYYEGCFQNTLNERMNLIVNASDGNDNYDIHKERLTNLSNNKDKAVIIAYPTEDASKKLYISKALRMAKTAMTNNYIRDITFFCSDVESVECNFSPEEDVIQDTFENVQNVRDLIVFVIDNEQCLSQTNITELINNNSDIHGNVIILYDTYCFDPIIESLSNINNPGIIITTRQNSKNSHSDNGDLSFSSVFWQKIGNGSSVYNSYKETTKIYEDFFEVLDTSNILYTNIIKEEAKKYYIGLGVTTANSSSSILSVSPLQTTGKSSEVSITATVSIPDEIKNVWVTIVPPEEEKVINISEKPEYSVKTFPMEHQGSGKYLFSNLEFEDYGIFEIVIYGVNIHDEITPFKKTRIINNNNYLPQDAIKLFIDIRQDDYLYEREQPHWFRFYGRRGSSYSIKAENVGETCDINMELFQREDFQTPIRRSNWEESGENEEILFSLHKNNSYMSGYYYIKVENLHPSNIILEKSNYQIWVESGGAPMDVGLIEGRVTDARTKEGLKNVEITSKDGDDECKSDEYGYFQINHKESKFEIVVYAWHPDYYTNSRVHINGIIDNQKINSFDIELQPKPKLADVIDLLSFLSGINEQKIDFKQYQKASLDDVIKLLQAIVNLE